MLDPLTEPFAGLCHALRDLRDQVEELAKVHESIDAFNHAFGGLQNAMELHASCLHFPQQPPPPVVKKKVSMAKDLYTTGIPLPQMSSSALPSTAPPISGRDSAGSISSSSSASTAGMSGSIDGGRKSSILKTGGSKSTSNPKKKPGGIPAASSVNQSKKSKKPTIQKRKGPPPKPAPPAWTWEQRMAVFIFEKYLNVLKSVPKKYQSPDELKKLENIILYIKNRSTGMYVALSLLTIADLVTHTGLAVIKSKEILQTLMKLDIIERKKEDTGFVYTFGVSS